MAEQASKHFADVLIDGQYINVSIWDMIRLKEKSPRKFELIKNCIYSTHRNSNYKYRMIFVCRKNKSSSHFRALSQQKVFDREGNKETITHESYKNILAGLKTLNLVIGENKISLSIYQSEIEYHKTVNGSPYSIDVYFWFNKSEPYYYVAKWGGELAFEIKYSHAVGDIKEEDFCIDNIALFEHKVSPKLTLENCNTEEKLKEGISLIKHYFSEKIYGKLLCDPERKEYIEMKELEESQNKIVSLQKQIQEKNKTIENYKEQLQDKEIQIKKQEVDLFALSGKLFESEKELKRIKNTFGFKLFIRK